MGMWPMSKNSPERILLSDGDKAILESYGSVLDGFAEYLGPAFEMVLHSVEDPEHSVIKIVNGAHTGRKVGDPMTALAREMLSIVQKNPEYDHLCYTTTNSKGEPLKSATFAIRGIGGRVIGLWCINMYLNTPLSDFIDVFQPRTMLSEDYHPQPFDVMTTADVQDRAVFARAATDGIAAAIDRARISVSADRSIKPSQYNKEIIELLYEQGIFQIKDSVPIVATALGISKNTVYLHLRTVRSDG